MTSPARGYSWPPLTSESERGNTKALTHGATSPRCVEPAAQAVVDELLELVAADGSPIAYLGDRSYWPAVRRWATVEAQLERLDAYFADVGLLDGDGNPRPATNLLVRLESRAETLRARLGLDPLSRARLGRDIAAGSVDMARLLSEVDDDQEADGGA